MRRSLAILVLVLGGCVAHEKAGDRAAALGDWKTALTEYRQAVASEPDNSELRRKFDEAKKTASSRAYARAKACIAAKDFECSVSEAKYALEIDDGNPEIAALLVDALRLLGMARVEAAVQAAGRGQIREALALLRKAQETSADSAVADACAAAKPDLVARAVFEVERLRAAKGYREALALLPPIIEVDATQRALLETIQREYELHLEQEYERLSAEGDRALEMQEWEAAALNYEAATRVRPVGRAVALGSYARSLLNAEAAKQRQDWLTAAKLYQDAVATGQDRSGYAARENERVELRPYRVRIRSAFVRPTRPDGQPWVGPPNNTALRVVAGIIDVASGGATGGMASVAAAKYDKITKAMPIENAPTLCVRVALPEGRGRRTTAERGIYVVYESDFVLVGNHFDTRRLSFRVTHDPTKGCDGVDVGAMDVSLADLLAKRESPGVLSLINLELMAEPAPEAVDGMFTSMSIIKDGSDLARGWSVARPGAVGFKLTRLVARIAGLDHRAEMMDGPPDLFVEIEQEGHEVFRTPTAQDSWDQIWNPTAAYLFVRPDEPIVVRCYDRDLSNHDILIQTRLPGKALRHGRFSVKTPAGSYLEVQVEPR